MNRSQQVGGCAQTNQVESSRLSRLLFERLDQPAAVNCWPNVQKKLAPKVKSLPREPPVLDSEYVFLHESTTILSGPVQIWSEFYPVLPRPAGWLAVRPPGPTWSCRPAGWPASPLARLGRPPKKCTFEVKIVFL